MGGFLTVTETDRNETQASGTGRRVAVFVRHGHFERPDETASAHSLLPLSETGHAQAAAAVGKIAARCANQGLEIDKRIEASQLLRAWQTANVLAEGLSERTGTPHHVIQRDEMIERGLGSAANLTFTRIRELVEADPRLGSLPEGWRRMPEYRLPLPGAESLMDAGKRAAARIAHSIESMPEDDPRDLARLFVAHSGCLRHAAVVLGAIDVRRVASLSMDFVQAVMIERFPDGSWRVVDGDFEKHLPGSGATR